MARGVPLLPLRATPPHHHYDERGRPVWLRKAKGGSGVGEWFWPEDGSVVEVADERIAAELLAIPDGGYTKADGPDPEPKPAPKAPAPAPAKAAPAAPAAAKAASAGK